MDSNMKVALEVSAKDSATPVVKGMRNELSRLATARSNLGVRAEHTIQREIQKTQASYNRMAKSGKLSEDELARAFGEMKKRVAALRAEMERESEQTISNYRRMANAREMLGISSEKDIQREIQRTEAAYNRLANSGVMSAQEQARAYSAMTAKVAALRKELKGAQHDESSLGKASVGKQMLAVGAGAAAGIHYLAPKITNSSEYSMELMKLSNRVFHGRDAAGRQKGKDEINDAVRSAIEQGGGTVPETLVGYEGLIASQAYSPAQANQLLPRINMTASSVGADSGKVAELASSLHFFQIPFDKIPGALSGVVRMGQMGPVDADVIAEYGKGMLEQLGSVGGASYQGLRAVLPLAESSALGASTPAQALTNATDLVNDILSPNLDSAAKRVKINGKKIKWHDSIIKMMGQGIDPLEAARTIVNKAIDNDSQYRSFNSQLNKTSDPVQRDRLQRQIQAVRGVYYGKFFRNQQARMAFIGYEQHYDKVKSLQDAMDQEYYGRPGELATDKDMKGVRKESEFKTTQASSLSILDQNSLMSPLARIEGDIASEFTKLDEVLPTVTKGLEGLAIALGTIGAVGATGIAADVMLGGGLTKKGYEALKRKWGAWRSKAATVADDVLEGVGHSAGEAGEAVVKGGSKLLRGVTRFGGGALSLFSGLLDSWSVHKDDSLTDAQKDKQYAVISTRSATAYAGAEAGAAAGTVVFPGPGTVIGGILGSIGGYYGGDWLGSMLPDSLFTRGASGKAQDTITPMDALGLNPQRLDVHLYVDGQEIHAALDDRTNRDALRN
ncbi:hypothetical protein [Trabulsiella odontotermitis]|uniref:Uncharacterized protein n=1 Tax=Trabulsiella odontotermitis TaxID=379893 RepID=A0A0L0GUX0_9ENTR|nr:hypothetical protein [Trabulsiella odontotermitis]KNC92777.1 hypothetical protein GM31_22055 [Trabulsiella odontotermitis]